jgi:hypothetical protein
MCCGYLGTQLDMCFENSAHTDGLRKFSLHVCSSKALIVLTRMSMRRCRVSCQRDDDSQREVWTAVKLDQGKHTLSAPGYCKSKVM